MPHKNKKSDLNIETLILVAIWEPPLIFQGCIKIKDLDKNKEVLYFFRCQSNFRTQIEILDNDFSSEEYQFTHLYNESGLIPLSIKDSTKLYALDIMKYALHISLKEMISSRKMHFRSIDDIAMQAMINKIKPILNQALPLEEEDDHLGFAVAMDFSPQEELGALAMHALLNQLG